MDLPWRRKWQPTLVFLPGKISWTEEPGGFTVCGVAESDTTEQVSTQHMIDLARNGLNVEALRV